jgi:hypothetical protein
MTDRDLWGEDRVMAEHTSWQKRAVVATVGTVALGLIAAAPASAAGPELIVNGSFENPAIPDASYRQNIAIPGWTFPQGSELRNNYFGAAAPGGGAQYIELNLSGQGGSAVQTFPTTPREKYALTFAYSPRAQSQPDTNKFTVTVAGTTTAFSPGAGSSTGNKWSTATISFTATAAQTTVAFVDDPAVGASGQSAEIDLVSVKSVDPCPPSALFCLGGFGS